MDRTKKLDRIFGGWQGWNQFTSCRQTDLRHGTIETWDTLRWGSSEKRRAMEDCLLVLADCAWELGTG